MRFASPLSWRCSAVVGAVLLSIVITAALPVRADEAVRFEPHGVKLEGNQFLYDAGFEVLDWNGDGKLDIFLPNTSMMSFAAHLNEGPPDAPRFGRAINYPVNLTETAPQTLEHGQAFAVCDLNGDALFDLILFDGQLRMIYNVGAPHGPNHWSLAKLPQYFPGSESMIKENARYATGPESMYWNKGIFARQALTLTVADWDGDGLDDLVICRFKDEAPGVQSAGGAEQWTSWGRVLVSRPRLPPPPADAPQYLEKLSQPPARGLYFYKNTGTKEQPWFDQEVEIRTPEGTSIAAPNPLVADMDGDGVLDLVSSESNYSCNAFRVDWPTAPHVVWFRRPKQEETAVLEPPRAVADASGQPVPAGVQARMVDLRGAGVKDLLVMDGDHQGTIRWYKNTAASSASTPAWAAAEVLRGKDFLRFDFMCQPVVVNWFGPGSRDLLIHGCTDAHCKFALRRTALYKNVAQKLGELKYELAGYFNFQGDPAMVPPSFEERPYDVYGSAVAVFPDDGNGQRRLLMSVDGKVYFFSQLAPDGLTFQQRTPLNLPSHRNRHRGWQEITLSPSQKVQYIRIGNDRNGMGNLRDSFLHIVNFEALVAGKNVATLDQGVQIADENGVDSPYYRVQRPTKMFTPGNAPSDTEPNFTTFGYYIGPATVTLKAPAPLEKIRFLLSDREARWYDIRLPFYWQGKLLRDGTEQGEPWYQYTVEVSADKKNWTTVADTMKTEMMRSVPHLTDWDGDGRVDLLLGVLNSKGIWPAEKEYRLYRNTGSNAAPKFDACQSLCDEHGQPLKLQAYWYLAYGIQCGVAAADLDADGKRDLIVEGHRNAELLYYRNVSNDSTSKLCFQRVRELGHPAPIRYDSGYRYFHLGDVDGDGVTDWINSASSSMAFFKGIAATAPARVDDLTVAEATAHSLQLRWTRPAGATHYDVRWSEEPITDLTWPRLPSHAQTYVAPATNDPVHIATLAGLPPGKTLYVAVKSINDAGDSSGLSNVAQGVLPPLRRIVLRNGPEQSAGVPAYAGNQACYLDAQKPTEAAPKEPAQLIARAQTPNGEKQKVILLRFRDLPKTGPLERAVLELTTDPGLQPNGALLQPIARLAVSCNAIRDDWDAARATYTAAAPGQPWAADELESGGQFLSMAQPEFTIAPRRTVRWDVTEAVRAAQQEGRMAISLLVRVDYTGYYIAGHGYNFCGPDFPAVEQRPRLCLTVRED